jgi:hypothetical protein
MPRKVFTAGEVLAAADVQEFLQDQAVMTFAGSAARSSAIASPTEGMVTYLADEDTFQFWNGTAYAPLAPSVSTPTIEYLVIAGGGGGSLLANTKAAGGGGAGGYRNSVAGELSGGTAVAELPIQLVNGTYTITVGGGGAGSTIDNSPGSQGSYSLFTQVLSIGGGHGKTFGGAAGAGGSGGGGCRDNTAAGVRTILQGFNGGAGSGSQNGGAGGGGAGAAGVTVTGSSGTNGGNGLASSITGSSVTRAGGGGGGGDSGATSSGGLGGGGAGANDANNAGNGTVNTGSGGGGSERAAGRGGNGGSGIVIFTVPTGTSVSFSGGVTQTNSTVGTKQVYVVTATSTTSETVTFA